MKIIISILVVIVVGMSKPAFGQVSISILKESGSQNNRLLKVRISKRVDVNALNNISTRLVLSYNAPDRMFIEYYLPNQKAGIGGMGQWAQTEHHNGSANKSSIRYSSLEAVEKLKNHSVKNGWAAANDKPAIWGTPAVIQHGGEIIGEWVFDVKYTLIKFGMNYLLNIYDESGGEHTIKLSRRKVANGLRFDDALTVPDYSVKLVGAKKLYNISPSDFYILNRKGQLEIWGSDGWKVTIEPQRR